MRFLPTPLVRILCLIIVAVSASLAIVLPAEAGCAMEFRECGECASEMLWDAIWSLSFSKYVDAELYGIDCEIDFLHCLLYAHHHSYDCDV